MNKSDLEKRLKDEFCDDACIGHERGCHGCPIADALEYINSRIAELEAALERAISMLYLKCEVCLRRENCASSSECRERWRNYLLEEAEKHVQEA